MAAHYVAWRHLTCLDEIDCFGLLQDFHDVHAFQAFNRFDESKAGHITALQFHNIMISLKSHLLTDFVRQNLVSVRQFSLCPSVPCLGQTVQSLSVRTLSRSDSPVYVRQNLVSVSQSSLCPSEPCLSQTVQSMSVRTSSRSDSPVCILTFLTRIRSV